MRVRRGPATVTGSVVAGQKASHWVSTPGKAQRRVDRKPGDLPPSRAPQATSVDRGSGATPTMDHPPARDSRRVSRRGLRTRLGPRDRQRPPTRHQRVRGRDLARRSRGRRGLRPGRLARDEHRRDGVRRRVRQRDRRARVGPIGPARLVLLRQRRQPGARRRSAAAEGGRLGVVGLSPVGRSDRRVDGRGPLARAVRTRLSDASRHRDGRSTAR